MTLLNGERGQAAGAQNADNQFLEQPPEPGTTETEPKPIETKDEQPFVTREELAQALIQRDQRFVETLNARDKALLQRAGRSATARARNAITAYHASLEAQKAAGIDVTPAQQAAVEDRIIKDAILKEEGETPPGQAQAGQAGSQATGEQQWAEYLLRQQQAVFRGAGATVVSGDPEYQDILDEWRNPDATEESFLDVSADAAKKKAARLAQEAETKRARTPTGGAGGSAKPNKIANINDSAKLYEMGDEEIRQQSAKR